MHLSPTELSKHAVELEKRAIQLTIEEGRQLLGFFELFMFCFIHELSAISWIYLRNV